jgi:hypothetical protein
MMATATATAMTTTMAMAAASTMVATATVGGTAQTTTTLLNLFQHWLLHPMLSRGSSSSTTSVTMAAPK